MFLSDISVFVSIVIASSQKFAHLSLRLSHVPVRCHPQTTAPNSLVRRSAVFSGHCCSSWGLRYSHISRELPDNWCPFGDSNPGPAGYEPAALPTELKGHVVRQKGFEPPARCLKGNCSNQLSGDIRVFGPGGNTAPCYRQAMSSNRTLIQLPCLISGFTTVSGKAWGDTLLVHPRGFEPRA